MTAFNRGGSGKPRYLDVGSVVHEVVELLSSTVPSNIEIGFRFDEGLPRVFMNRVQLHQLIMNLTINARDAIQGSGEIRIENTHEVAAEFTCTSCREHVQGDFVTPPCLNAADVNDDEAVGLTDSIDLLVWLFLGGFPPPPPTPLDVTGAPSPLYDAPTSCAPDPTLGGLGCAAFPPCPIPCR